VSKTHIDESGNLKFPSWANRGLDTDVIVSEVRETSRKPDEAYGMIERMCPGDARLRFSGGNIIPDLGEFASMYMSSAITQCSGLTDG